MNEDLVNPLFLWSDRGPLQTPGTINESRRAQALMRSLYKSVQTFPGQEATLTTASSPAIGRRATLAVQPNPKGKLATSNINFFSIDPQYNPAGDRYFSTFGTGDKPFRGGLKDAKFQGLLSQLGDLFDRMPPGSVSGVGTESQRKKAYQRFTGNALGPTGQGFVRPNGQFQPRDEKGRLGKAVPNPSRRLKDGLTRLAYGNVVRAAEPYMRQLFNVHPALKGYYNFESIIQDITGKSPTRETIKAANEQIKKSLTAAPSLNFGPLLPF